MTRVIRKWQIRHAVPLPVLGIGFLEQAAFVVLFLFLTQRYLPDDRALGVAFAGFAIMVFGLTKLVAQPPAGWLGDRIGYRRTLVLGFSTSLIATIVIMISQQAWLFLAATALYSLGKAPVGPGLSATVANLFEEENRGKVVACTNLANLGALVLGGLGGFLLLDVITAPIAFSVSIVLNLGALLVAMFFLKETAFMAAVPGRAWRLPALPLGELANPHVLAWGAIVLLLGIGMGLMGPLARPYIRDVLGMEVRELVPYLILPAALAAVSIIPFGHLADRLGRIRPLVLGLGMGSLGLLGVSVTTSLFAIMGLASLIMLSYTMTVPAVGAALMDVTREEVRGFVLGALATVQGLGGALGPAIGGSIYESWSPQDVFVVAGAILGGALLLVVVYGTRRQIAYALSPVFADD